MEFARLLETGRLVRRYKRFLADVEMDWGDRITCHCPNTGSMMGCAEPGSRVWLSRSDNPKRKYAHTWELVEAEPGVVVGINTGLANRLVAEALDRGLIPELAGFTARRAEARVPGLPMRADFRLDGGAGAACTVEVKNVTAAAQAGTALFPDAVSERGRRHLEVLSELAASGERAALVYCVQRGDVEEVRPADEIDPAYGRALRAAIAGGVEVYAVGAEPRADGISLDRRVSVYCP